jgi:hypothetical protein
MSFHEKHPSRIVSSNLGWQKAIKCTILLKSVVAILVMASVGAVAADHSPSSQVKQASSGATVPCQPPQTQHADASKVKVAARSQRNVGNPSLTPAMALSIALGLRTATGPMVKLERSAARAMPSAVKDASVRTERNGRIALVPGADRSACVLSGTADYPKLAMED